MSIYKKYNIAIDGKKTYVFALKNLTIEEAKKQIKESTDPIQTEKLKRDLKNINLDVVLIRDVTLPQTLQDAIEKKLKQEQAELLARKKIGYYSADEKIK